MREAMRRDRMEALEIEHRLDEPRAGGIAVQCGENVGAKGRADRRLAGNDVEIGLADELGRDLVMAEPRRKPLDDRRLQAGLIEDGRRDPAGNMRLAAHDLLGLELDAREDRIRPDRVLCTLASRRIAENHARTSRERSALS